MSRALLAMASRRNAALGRVEWISALWPICVDALEERVLAIEPSAVKFLAKSLERLPNTSKFATKGLTSEVQVMGLDLDGASISAGSACSAGRVETPYVLAAMGVPDELGLCAVRISLGWTTTPADIDGFIVTGWQKLHDRKLGQG